MMLLTLEHLYNRVIFIINLEPLLPFFQQSLHLFLTEFVGQCGHKLRHRQEHGGDYLSNSHILEQQYAVDGWVDGGVLDVRH